MDDQERPPVLQIEDFDSWLRANALPSNGGSSSDLNREEERARFQQFSAYQAAVHQHIFANDQQEVEEAQQLARERKQRLEAWNDTTITVFAAAQEVVGHEQRRQRVAIRNVPLRPLASSCETIYALASSWGRYSQRKLEQEEEDSREKEGDEYHVSLEDYPETSVRAFLALVAETNNSSLPPTTSDDDDSHHDKSIPNEFSGESIVDCCRIASYLQNEAILRQTEDILLDSLDSDNCRSIAQLADSLDLQRLFEAAVRIMLKSLMGLENNTETWDYLDAELQDRILAIKAAFESSVHSNKSDLYFSSLTEYISIFAERVQYNRERLAEAKEQHENMTTGTRSWADTGAKIAKQEQRVRTLERVLAEQKRLFVGKGLLPPRRQE